MNKKILFLTVVLFILVFVPITKVSATQTYIGVQIAATQPINGSGVAVPTSLWCLPIGSNLAIMNYAGTSNITAVSPSVNPTVTTVPTCPLSTIWSGLVDLTNGTQYKIRIWPNTAMPFCSGYTDGTYCLETWDVVGENKNCNDVCVHYGQVNRTDSNWPTYDCGTYANCNQIALIKGSPCTTCTAGSYDYYDKNGNCWYYSGWCNRTWSDPNYTRVCKCLPTNTSSGTFNFDFPFTPSGL